LARCARPAGAKSASARATTTRHTAGATTTGPEARTCSASTATPAAARTFRGKNHLQELVGVLKEILELVTLGAERFGSELCRHFDPGNGRIFRHVTNLVDLDAGFTGERGF
jgi:hypothetical protein